MGAKPGAPETRIHRAGPSRYFLLFFLALMLSTTVHSQDHRYVIQLGQYPAAAVELGPGLSKLQAIQVYAVSPDRGESWRLKAGFFDSEDQARQLARSLHASYPDLEVLPVRQVEQRAVEANRVKPSASDPTKADLVVALGNRRQIDLQLKRAAALYGQQEYDQAIGIYQLLSQVPNPGQAAWALELYGVCLEKQNEHDGAMNIYTRWLAQYPDSAGEPRVRQRLAALNTAATEPRAARRKANKRRGDNAIYGSTSVFYRGLRRKVNDQQAETAINSLQADLDLHIRGHAGNFLVRSRVNGGYLSDLSSHQRSDGRISNLYLDATHQPSGAELTLGRQRTNENGIYGYLDGLALLYPVTDKFALSLVGGSVALNSRETVGSQRRVFGLGSDIHFDNPGWQLHIYAVEQTFEGLTERRAVGGEVSYFNTFSHYLFIADYDIKFNEPNNLLFNGNWNLSQSTNLALSAGYQRSPFLTASNALIGEYDIDLDRFVEGLDEDTDIYDAALAKTAISRYGSLVINQQLSERLRVIGELYRYEMTDLPVFDPAFDSPDSDANTTLGLQFVLSDGIFDNDYLSTGARYTHGDTSNSASLYADEKLRFNQSINLTLRLLGSRRWVNNADRDTYTLRPALRLNWFFNPTFLLDAELGYEWLSQQFETMDFEARQTYLMLGLRKRF